MEHRWLYSRRQPCCHLSLSLSLSPSPSPLVEGRPSNEAANSFFYYDLEGDTYLDRREFTAARRGETFDS